MVLRAAVRAVALSACTSWQVCPWARAKAQRVRMLEAYLVRAALAMSWRYICYNRGRLWAVGLRHKLRSCQLRGSSLSARAKARGLVSHPIGPQDAYVELAVSGSGENGRHSAHHGTV